MLQARCEAKNTFCALMTPPSRPVYISGVVPEVSSARRGYGCHSMYFSVLVRCWGTLTGPGSAASGCFSVAQMTNLQESCLSE